MSGCAEDTRLCTAAAAGGAHTKKKLTPQQAGHAVVAQQDPKVEAVRRANIIKVAGAPDGHAELQVAQPLLRPSRGSGGHLDQGRRPPSCTPRARAGQRRGSTALLHRSDRPRLGRAL